MPIDLPGKKHLNNLEVPDVSFGFDPCYGSNSIMSQNISEIF